MLGSKLQMNRFCLVVDYHCEGSATKGAIPSSFQNILPTLRLHGFEPESVHEVSIPATVPGVPEVAPGTVRGGGCLDPLAGPTATGHAQPVQGCIVA